MSENDRMETASTEVTSIWRRNDIEKSTWRTHRYFVDFEIRIHVEISTSNQCHNSHVDSPFKIDIISTNFPRGISTSNPWQIDEDVSIGIAWNADKLTHMHDLTWVINNVNMCICVSMYICLCTYWGVYVYKFFFSFTLSLILVLIWGVTMKISHFSPFRAIQPLLMLCFFFLRLYQFLYSFSLGLYLWGNKTYLLT